MSIDKVKPEEWDKANRELATERQVGGSHYKGKAQPIEYIIKNNISWCLGNSIKYITRSGKKGSKKDHIKDLRKAIHYIELELQHTYGVNPQGEPIMEKIVKPDIDCEKIDFEIFMKKQYDFYKRQNTGEIILDYAEWSADNLEDLKEEYLEYGQAV